MLYPEFKLYRYGDIDETYFSDFWGEDQEAISQTFKFSGGGTMQINKVQFPARIYDESEVTTGTVNVSIFNVDSENVPTTLIGTTTVTITGLTNQLYEANFTTPITVSNDFAVVLEVATENAVIEFVITDPVPNQSFDENLTKLRSTYPDYNSNGQFISPQTYTAGWTGGPYQFDLLVRPIISYTADVSFASMAIEECLGNEVDLVANVTPHAAFSSHTMNYYSMLKHFGETTVDSTYIWNADNAANILYFGDSSATHSYLNAGTYQTEFVAFGGLINLCLISVDGPTVTITEAPLVTFPALANICVDAGSLTLNTATPAGGTYTGTGVTNGVFNPEAAGLGTHTLTYTLVDGGCTLVQGQTIVVEECLSIDQTLAGVTKIYPNPSNGQFAIELNSSDEIQLQVVTVDGKVILATQQLKNGLNTIQLSGVSQGVYILKLTSANGQYTQRISIQ